MSARFKIGRNAACPCGSDQKYKHCCLGKKDWCEIISQGRSEQVRHLTARGKNLVFLGELASALKFDSLEPKSRADIKRAFTPSAVQQIYETVANLWPDKQDLERTLAQEKSKTTGLYVGTYEPEVIFRGVTRHCIYSDTILLVNPFLHPLRLRPEYNPLVHPEEHRVSAIIAANIWFSLAPWIEAGIVKFIRVSAELQERIRDAESEWRKIDTELIRWFGGLGAIATPFIAAGGATWIPAAVSTVVGGAAALAHSQHQRSTWEKRYPAGFFLDLKKQTKK